MLARLALNCRYIPLCRGLENVDVLRWASQCAAKDVPDCCSKHGVDNVGRFEVYFCLCFPLILT